MGDRIKRWHATESSFALKKRARKGIYMFGARNGDDVILYSVSSGAKHFLPK